MSEIIRWYFFFFFFQAEDGIRDSSVTGVQTCALPIYSRGFADGNDSRRNGRARFSLIGIATAGVPCESGSRLLHIGLEPTRSEERRVGKECRSRWSPYH